MTEICTPDHGPHYARGLCRRCYQRERWHGRHITHPRRNRPALDLAAAAHRLRAELEAAGPYATTPATWPAIARRLGVKFETLERALTRARRYAKEAA
jgi:hypothetical protein